MASQRTAYRLAPRFIVALMYFAIGLSVQLTAAAATIVVPDQRATIQSAIDAASPGDTVQIKGGVYTERLHLQNGINLAGEGSGTVTIRGTVDLGTLLLAEHVENASVSGITFEHTNAETGQNRNYPDLLIVRDSKLSIVRCEFRKSAGCGIVVRENSTAEISGCRCEDNTQYGIVAQKKSAVTIRANECLRNGYSGIAIVMDARGSVEDNTSSENAVSGIYIGDEGAPITLRKNTCLKNQSGIRVDTCKDATVEENTCRENSQDGIYITLGANAHVSKNISEDNGSSGAEISGLCTKADLQENTLHKNKRSGAFIFWGATCEAAKNECVENGQSGIAAGGWHTTATLHGNQCLRNGRNGIVCSNQGTIKTSGCVCRENKEKGVYVTDEGSTLETDGDTIEENAKGNLVREAGSPLGEQYWINPASVGSALCGEQFDLLETLAAELRKYKPIDKSAENMLEEFYAGLITVRQWKSPACQANFAKLMGNWRKAYPQSPAPLIALADAEVDYAWQARGSGYARSVTEDGWRGFREHLKKASVLLEEAGAMDVKDPAVYATMIQVAMGQSLGDDETRAFYDKGAAIDDTYVLLHKNYLYSLLPKWGGAPGAAESFIEEVSKKEDKEAGDRMYAALISRLAAQNMENPGIVSSLSWSRAEEGFQLLEKKFPDTDFYLNRHCFIACAFQDQKRAKELFAQIGENPNYDAWQDGAGCYKACKRWADGFTPSPIAAQGQNYPASQVEKTFNKIAAAAPIIGVVLLLGAISLVAFIVVKYGRT